MSLILNKTSLLWLVGRPAIDTREDWSNELFSLIQQAFNEQ